MAKGPELGEYDAKASTLVTPESFLGQIEKQRSDVLTSLGWENPQSLCLIGLPEASNNPTRKIEPPRP